MGKTLTRRVVAHVDEQTHAALKARAERDDRSESAIIRQALRAYLGTNGREQA